jgi:hypothetical protein
MVFSEFHSRIEGPFRREFNARLFLSKNEKNDAAKMALKH